MSDWQVGDLAVCVAAGDYSQPGQVFTVYAINSWGLRLEELRAHYWADHIWSTVERFHKILPDKHEQCEPEFVTLLKRIKHTVSA